MQNQVFYRTGIFGIFFSSSYVPGVDHGGRIGSGPNVLCGGAQLLNGPTRTIFNMSEIAYGMCEAFRDCLYCFSFDFHIVFIVVACTGRDASMGRQRECDLIEIIATAVARGIGDGEIRLHWSRRLHIIVQNPGTRAE